MQANWNGLFLDEPRFRIPLNLAIVGLLLQIGLAFFPVGVWTSLGNLVFAVAVMVVMSSVQAVLHPESPIFTSGERQIQLFFLGLLILLLALVLPDCPPVAEEAARQGSNLPVERWMNFEATCKFRNWFWFGLTLALIAVVTLLGPAERSLGSQVRVVYLHGAWVWTALAAFVAAGVIGLVGLLTRRDELAVLVA